MKDKILPQTRGAKSDMFVQRVVSVLLTPVGSTCWQYLLAVPVVSVLLISVLLTTLWNKKVGFRSGALIL